MKPEIKALKSELISGKYLNLRIASEKDAEFILELRLNPILNKYIHPTDPSVEKQKQWIRSSFENENDFHFIIEDKNLIPQGTLAVYDIDYDKGIAEWGRWLIKPGAPFFFPVESIILIMHFAFRKLNLVKLYGGSNNLNKRVVAFHKMFADVPFEDDKSTWFTLEEKNLERLASRFSGRHNLQL